MSTQTAKPPIDESAFRKVFAKNLGVEEKTLGSPNPVNEDVLYGLEHTDIDGVESLAFSQCFQKIRNEVGPFKLFGSK